MKREKGKGKREIENVNCKGKRVFKSLKFKGKRIKKEFNFTLYTLHFKLLFALLFALLTLSGCWDITEIDRRSTIISLSLDAAPDNKVLVSAQIPLPQTSLLALGAGSSEKPFHTITSIGKPGYGAVLGLESKAIRKIFYGQMQSVVVNTALAERGLKANFEFLFRHPEIPGQAIVALTETTAQDILDVPLGNKFLPGLAIHDFLISPAKADEVFPIRIWQFTKAIEVPPIDAYLPIISYNKDEQVYKFGGLGVFHRDRLVGKLDDNEARMVGMMMGKSGSATIIVPIGQLGEVSYRRVANKSKITILKTYPNNEFLIRVTARGFGPEITSDKTNLSLNEIKEIERASAQSLKKDMIATLRHLQSLNSDIIGFGDLIRANKPEIWKGLDWDAEFPKVSFQVKVKFILERVGEYR